MNDLYLATTLPLQHKWELFTKKLLLAPAQFHLLKFHPFSLSPDSASLSFCARGNSSLLKTKQNKKDNHLFTWVLGRAHKRLEGMS